MLADVMTGWKRLYLVRKGYYNLGHLILIKTGKARLCLVISVLPMQGNFRLRYAMFRCCQVWL